MKCDVIDGSVLKEIREPVPFSFILDKAQGYKLIYESETKPYEKKTFFEIYNVLSRRQWSQRS